MEPRVGVEPTTSALRKLRSTTELPGRASQQPIKVGPLGPESTPSAILAERGILSRIVPINTSVCPRCRAPVQGDYKFCPECAYRLRPGAPAPEEGPVGGGARGRFLLGAFALGLVVAGFLVGWQLFIEGSVPRPQPVREPAERPLRVADIQDQLVRVDTGVATYRNVQVFDVPDASEAADRLQIDFAADGGADFLERLMDEPAGLSRWARLLKALHERTASYVEPRERAVPVETAPLKVMRHEVTCGQYAEGLRAIQKKPRLLSGQPWVQALWRPQDETAEANARGYHLYWWQPVAEHHKKAHGREVKPPAWLALDSGTRPSLTDAQAVLLMIPPHWVHIDEKDRITWDVPEGHVNLPVTNISWWDAHLFAYWAGQHLGMDLRLPNGAEHMRIFHGNHPAKPADDFDSVATPGWRWPWGDEYDAHGCNNATRSVKEKKPEKLRNVLKRYGWHEGKTVDGVLNMAGNAAEWVDNWFAEYPQGQTSGPLRAFRREVLPASEDFPSRAIQFAYAAGGSYTMGIEDCSVTLNRQEDKRARKTDVGFRLVLEQFLR